MLDTWRFHGLKIVPPRTTTLRMSRGMLAEILTCQPDELRSIDRKRWDGKLERLKFDCDLGPGQVWRVICACQKRSVLTNGFFDTTIPMKSVIQITNLEWHPFHLEGWLTLDIYVGQCRSCGRVYYG